jgi:hypothetical protein
MAGSKSYRQYISDNGTTYTVLVDESNAEAVIGTGTLPLIPARTAASGRLPTGIVQRYLLCSLVSNPRIRRKFKVGNPGLIGTALAPGAIIKAQVYPTSADAATTTEDWNVTAYRGEKINSVPGLLAIDTGLIDGDTTQ